MTQPESKPPRSNELEQEWLDFLNGKEPTDADVGRFAAQVEERERERCAEIALDDPQQHNHPFEHQRKACLRCKIAAAIRERSRG